jgi:hypothetical protein
VSCLVDDVVTLVASWDGCKYINVSADPAQRVHGPNVVGIGTWASAISTHDMLCIDCPVMHADCCYRLAGPVSVSLLLMLILNPSLWYWLCCCCCRVRNGPHRREGSIARGCESVLQVVSGAASLSRGRLLLRPPLRLWRFVCFLRAVTYGQVDLCALSATRNHSM